MTPQEIRDAIAARPDLQALGQDTQAIADALSVGRRKLVPTEIGTGTILDVCQGVGEGGGKFLDTLQTIGGQNRDVFWSFDLIKRGALRIDLAATRIGLEQIKAAVPTIAGEIDAILSLGYGPDPVSEMDVRRACVADDGAWRA